jgi:hypothetical protein
VQGLGELDAGRWLRDGQRLTLCLDLPKGETTIG